MRLLQAAVSPVKALNPTPCPLLTVWHAVGGTPPNSPSPIIKPSLPVPDPHLACWPCVPWLQVLREFEVDVDIGGNAVALHPPGHVELGLCDTRGLVEIPLRLTKSEWRPSWTCAAAGLCCSAAAVQCCCCAVLLLSRCVHQAAGCGLQCSPQLRAAACVFRVLGHPGKAQWGLA